MNRSNRHGASLVPLIAAGVVVLAAMGLLLANSSGSGASKDDILAQIAEAPEGSGLVVNPVRATPASNPVEQKTPPATTRDASAGKSAPPQEVPKTSSGNGLDDSATLPYANAKEAPAPFQFELPYLDLGVIEPGSFHTSVVEVENISSDRLTVRNIYTGCKCTTAYFENERQIIEPGERLNLIIETEAGFNLVIKAVSVSIAVREYTSAARFTTKFSVNNIVASSPTFVNAKDRKSGRISLNSLDGRPFRILSVNGEPPVYTNMDDYDPSSGEPRSLFTIAWDYSGMSLPPRLMVVETDHPKNPVIGLPVYSREMDIHSRNHERGNIIGEQRTYNLKHVAPGETREITVEFGNLDQLQRKRAIFYDNDSITAEHIDSRPSEEQGKSYETFRLTFADDFPLGSFQTPMTFEVGSNATWLWVYGVGRADDAAN